MSPSHGSQSMRPRRPKKEPCCLCPSTTDGWHTLCGDSAAAGHVSSLASSPSSHLAFPSPLQKPTIVYSRFAYAFNGASLLVLLTAVLGFSIVGCLSTFSLNDALPSAVVLFNVSLQRPVADARETREHIMSFKARLERTATTANAYLQGVPNFTAALILARSSLGAVRGEVRGLRMFIEGCSNVSTSPNATCNASFLATNWRPCINGSITAGTNAGTGAVMSNGESVPVCRAASGGGGKACPCCTTCALIEGQIDSVLLSLSDSAAALSLKLDPSLVASALDSLWLVAKPSYDLLVSSVAEVEEAMRDTLASLRDSRSLVQAIAVIAWVPAWVIVLCYALAAGDMRPPSMLSKSSFSATRCFVPGRAKLKWPSVRSPAARMRGMGGPKMPDCLIV